MMPAEIYEQIFCPFCDSQRCQTMAGTNIAEICPYWDLRQKLLAGEKQ